GLTLNAGGAGSSCTINVQYNPNGNSGNSTAHIHLTDTGAVTSVNNNPTNTQNGPNFTGN
ncbi:MAG TPA: hypothetical protein VGF08_09920, partial [Terriglobales bacterium]